MKKKAVIFDMDGVIIDSEPLWQQAQQTALADYGVSVTVEECVQYTMGKRADEIADTWCQRYELKAAPKVLEKSILSCLRNLIASHGQPMKGLHNALDFFKRNNMTIALATSSNHSIINSVFNKLGLWSHFSIIRSAEDEEFGKPHPGVYLTTALSKRLILASNSWIFCCSGVKALTVGVSPPRSIFSCSTQRRKAVSPMSRERAASDIE